MVAALDGMKGLINIADDEELEGIHKLVIEGMIRGDNGGPIEEWMQGNRMLIEEITEIGDKGMKA